ncbi:hypothetical protein [Amycolatopsis sacchari]|uniref:hypothetical protein n=1 Tax=Amycolatopsis sacchari TaxID=115433 RepID=UPI000B83AC75|nr:hypothetical protein [Amycolatopsis sacchari]
MGPGDQYPEGERGDQQVDAEFQVHSGRELATADGGLQHPRAAARRGADTLVSRISTSALVTFSRISSVSIACFAARRRLARVGPPPVPCYASAGG